MNEATLFHNAFYSQIRPRLEAARRSWKWILPNHHEKNSFEGSDVLVRCLVAIQENYLEYPLTAQDERWDLTFFRDELETEEECTVYNVFTGENRQNWWGFHTRLHVGNIQVFDITYSEYEGKVLVCSRYPMLGLNGWIDLELYGCFYIDSEEVFKAVDGWSLHTDNGVTVQMPRRVRERLSKIWHFFLQTRPTLYNKEYVHSDRVRINETQYRYTDRVIGTIYIGFKLDEPSRVVEWVTGTKEETYRYRRNRNVEITLGDNIYYLGGVSPYLKCEKAYDILPPLSESEEREYEHRELERRNATSDFNMPRAIHNRDHTDITRL